MMQPKEIPEPKDQQAAKSEVVGRAEPPAQIASQLASLPSVQVESQGSYDLQAIIAQSYAHERFLVSARALSLV